MDNNIECIDDFLSTTDFVQNVEHTDIMDYHPVNNKDEGSIWYKSNTNTNPEVSSSYMFTFDEALQAELSQISNAQIYPTKSPIDKILNKIIGFSQTTSFVGKANEEWAGIICSVYKYKTGGRLVWHTDSTSYTGAFIYYLNKKWEPNWGGALLYSKNPTEDLDKGHFLLPKPNRMVIFRSPLQHSIAPITAPQGTERIALTGFFVKKIMTEKLISRFLKYNGS